jgi:tetratricopeptide (TPR) repeat protein
LGIVIWAKPVQAFLSECLLPRLLPRHVLPVFLLGLLGVAAPAQQNPAGFDALAASAAAARDNHDAPRAIQLYTQAEQLKPDWPGGWWSLGLLHYATKSWSEARNAFTHYIELSPESTPAVAQAIALRGLCSFETGDFSQSLADLQRSIALGVTDDPGSAILIRLREAQVLTRLGRFEESLLVYGSLAKAGLPAQRGPEWNIGVGLAGLRNPQLPGDVPAGQQEMFAEAGDAALLFMSGDGPAAQQAFAGFFQRYPDTANAHYLYGLLMLPTDPDATVEEYKRELEIAPANVTAAAMLAWVLLSQSKPEHALPFAQRAVSEAPALPVAQLVLGRSLAETGDLPGGIEHLETALQLQPGYLETHVALATAYASSGREQDARRERIQSLAMAEAHSAKR